MNYLPSTMAEFDAIVNAPETVPTHVLEEIFMWLAHMAGSPFRQKIRELLLERNDRVVYRETTYAKREPQTVGDLMKAGVPLSLIKKARCYYDREVFGTKYDNAWKPKRSSTLKASEKELKQLLEHLQNEYDGNPAAEEITRNGNMILKLLEEWRDIKRSKKVQPRGREWTYKQAKPVVQEIVRRKGDGVFKSVVEKILQTEHGRDPKEAAKLVQACINMGGIEAGTVTPRLFTLPEGVPQPDWHVNETSLWLPDSRRITSPQGTKWVYVREGEDEFLKELEALEV